jgi:hypothetical protein
MQSSSIPARTGASLSILGALLILSSSFLPIVAYGTGVYVTLPLVFLALTLLGISVFASLRKSPGWLVALRFVLCICGLLFILFILWGIAAFSCFDVCVPVGPSIGFWLALAGLLLIGLAPLVAYFVTHPPQKGLISK